MENLMKFLQKLFAEKNNLQVNIKTKYRRIKKGDNNTEVRRKVKKLGCLLDNKDDIEHRKQLTKNQQSATQIEF